LRFEEAGEVTVLSGIAVALVVLIYSSHLLDEWRRR
jgi:hypothetical protein